MILIKINGKSSPDDIFETGEDYKIKYRKRNDKRIDHLFRIGRNHVHRIRNDDVSKTNERSRKS